ncbi:MAG TPA: oligosaccharide flippase family protein [Thermoanaerobaculia bacterium]
MTDRPDRLPRRPFAHSAVLLAGSDLLGRAVLFLISPLLTRLLTPAQYGSYALLLSVAAVLALVQYGGMDAAFPFFRARAADHQAEERIVVTASVVVTASALVIALVACIVAAVTPPLRRLAQLSTTEMLIFCAALFPMAMSGWHQYVFRYLRETGRFVRVTLLSQVGGPLIAVPLMTLVRQEQRLMAFLLVILLAQAAAALWALGQYAGMHLRMYRRVAFSGALAKEMLHYGLRLVPAFLLYAASFHAGRWLLAWFDGAASVSALAIAALLSSAALIIRAWFSFFWDPYVAHWIAVDPPSVYLPRMQAAVPLVASVLFALTAVAVVWADVVIRILYPPSYLGAAKLVPFLLCAATCSALSAVAISTVLIGNTPRFHLPLYAAALIIDVAACLVLVPSRGALGAAWANFATELFILASWIAVGWFVLRNLRIGWTAALFQLTVAVLLAAVYQPGALWSEHVLAERCIVTLLAVGIIAGAGAWALREQWPQVSRMISTRGVPAPLAATE